MLASEILTATAALLASDTFPKWGQGKNFSSKEGGCMCGHGAIDYVGLPDIYSGIGDFSNSSAVLAAETNGSKWSSVLEDTSVADAIASMDELYVQTYEVPPEMASKSEVLMAHYFASRVGLTFDYNDAPERTLEEVVSKLTEAAELAVKNG